MMNDTKLYVIFNGDPILEFDRIKPVPGHQRQYLDNMDAKMDEGIRLGNDFIEAPNALQRCQFVANSLVNALLKENDALAAAMCTYLAKRMPDLQQIKCEDGNRAPPADSNHPLKDSEGDISIEFVYDRSFAKAQQEQTVQFFKPDNASRH